MAGPACQGGRAPLIPHQDQERHLTPDRCKHRSSVDIGKGLNHGYRYVRARVAHFFRTGEPMQVTCFKCGQQGHVASACQWGKELSEGESRPDWCGTCDRRTRLILVTTDQGEKAMRCDCHPLGGKMPRQFTRCPGCRTAIYAWDMNPCDHHQAIGARLSYHPMPDVRPHDDDVELAKRQLAEFRASRAIAWSLPADTVDAGNPRPQGDQLAPPAGPPVT